MCNLWITIYAGIRQCLGLEQSIQRIPSLLTVYSTDSSEDIRPLLSQPYREIITVEQSSSDEDDIAGTYESDSVTSVYTNPGVSGIGRYVDDDIVSISTNSGNSADLDSEQQILRQYYYREVEANYLDSLM